MSTTGDSSWADAGLIPPAEVDLPDEARSATPPPADDGEDHHPAPARPDLTDLADEPDVVEQAMAVPDETDDYPEA